MTPLTGGCLCDAIRYRCDAEPLGGGHCYCHDCRRSSGTTHSSHLAVPRVGFHLTGRPTTYTRAADSGNLVTRAFCGTCGAPLYSENAAAPDVVFLRASSLDDPERFAPAMIVFAARAPSWARLDPALPTFPAMAPPAERPVALPSPR